MRTATTTLLGMIGLTLATACGTSADADTTEVAHAPLVEPEPGPDQRFFIPHLSAWTIERGAPETYRVVAYGDSIFAGFREHVVDLARRAAPYVAGEYLAKDWNANVEVVRRTRSGAIAREVYEKGVVADKSYMADPRTRAVFFEMCGNDYLQARSEFESTGGTCSNAKLDAALATCKLHMEKSMVMINSVALTATKKVISNIYYPGFAGDNVPARCTGPSGEPVIIQDRLLPYMARSNWNACTIARANGFSCADSFAAFMGADFDSNNDGLIDAEALRFDPTESEDDYVKRITVTLRSTLRDSNKHATTPEGGTADYLGNDDIHPTHYLGTIRTGSTGRAVPDFTDAQLEGRNPHWNLHGHERMGYELWRTE